MVEECCKKCYYGRSLYSQCSRYKKYSNDPEKCKEFVTNKWEAEKLEKKLKEELLADMLMEGYEAKFNIGDTAYYREYPSIIVQTTIRDIIGDNHYKKFQYKVKNKINTIEEDKLFTNEHDVYLALVNDTYKRLTGEATYILEKSIKHGLTEDEVKCLRKICE